LLGSLLFSWAEKSKLYRLHVQLNHFCQTVESCLILHTPLQQEVKLLNEIKMQTTHLKNLPHNLFEIMQPLVSKMDSLVEKNDHTQVLERLLNDFSRQVQGAAGIELKQLANTLQHLTIALGDLPQHFNAAGQQLQTTQHEVGQLNDDIIQKLRQTAVELKDSTQHFYTVAAPLANAVETFQKMLARLENLTQTLNGFEQSHISALQMMEKTSQNMAQAWESYQNRFEKVDEDVAQIFQHLSKGLEDYRRQVEHFTGGLDSSMNTAVQSLNQVIAELVEALEDWHQQNHRQHQRKN